MSNINLAVGLMPVNMPYGNVKARMYDVAAANATDLFIGDPAALDTTGTVIRATEGAGYYLIGAIIGCFDNTGAPLAYLPSSTAGKVLVADDPEQEFLIQEDGVVSDLATTDVGQNVDLKSAAGSTFRNRSGFQIDSSSVTTSTNAQLRIIAKQAVINNNVGDYCKWIVKVNYHQLNAEVLGKSI